LNPVPRVAFFTDSFQEVNGVAHTSRHFEAFARRRQLPFLTVHAGSVDSFTSDRNLATLQLRVSPFSIPLETDMKFDLRFYRHSQTVLRRVREFGANLIHVTGPSHIGILGAITAHKLGIPIVASWHTNIHEYGARRLKGILRWLPDSVTNSLAAAAEQDVLLNVLIRYYRLARVILAPNPELVEMLRMRTGRPAFLMGRGIDTELFTPAKRRAPDHPLTIGYVGRLSTEKSVRVLRDVEQALFNSGAPPFRILIVGEGRERRWLTEHLRHAEFTGVLKGEVLARAYADMDIFAFPSQTDTFGNVVQEAMASGVPSVVTSEGGPRHVTIPGITGLAASGVSDFSAAVVRLATDPEMRQRLSLQCRAVALTRTWDDVFGDVYAAYAHCLAAAPAPQSTDTTFITSPLGGANRRL